MGEDKGELGSEGGSGGVERREEADFGTKGGEEAAVASRP